MTPDQRGPISGAPSATVAPMDKLSLEADGVVLVVVDIQERLVAAMPEALGESCVQNAVRLVEGARLLGVPVMVTEQYPKGLGHTVAPLREALDRVEDGTTPIEKVEFDACRCAGFADGIGALGDRRTVILSGMEAHICVWQTARGLLGQGLSVHVPFDATCSRNPENRRIAEGLWAQAGAVVTCTETVLFDLLGKAGGDAFKQISRLVR